MNVLMDGLMDELVWTCACGAGLFSRSSVEPLAWIIIP